MKIGNNLKRTFKIIVLIICSIVLLSSVFIIPALAYSLIDDTYIALSIAFITGVIWYLGLFLLFNSSLNKRLNNWMMES
jgi:hypothetical protein